MFEQVCQTVGYAHSRGIIHRDLKPANVMVGAFGEVQVMDWGLAKELAGAEPGPAPDPRPDPDGDPDATQTGTVLGTPAYMPPEQARGEVGRLDPRADVFALGAILCDLLTGAPPYPGATPDVTYAQAAGGHLAPAAARLAACGGDPDVVALCRRCLAADPADRPADAGEVAARLADVRAGAADRLRRADLDRATAAEGRKRRRAQAGFAAVVALLAGAAGAFAWWEDRRAGRDRADREWAEASAADLAARVRQAVTADLDGATDALRRGQWAAADARSGRADARLGAAGPADLRDRLAALRADLAVARDLDGVVDRSVTWVGDRFDTATTPAGYEAAFARYGLRVGVGDPAGAAARVAGSPVRDRLVAGLDEWLALAGSTPHLPALLERVDPDPFRSAVRKTALKSDPAALVALARAADPAALTPGFAVVLTRYPDLPPADAIALLAAVWRRHPTDFRVAFELGTRLDGAANRPAEAAGYLRAAVALRPNNSAAWNNLAVCQHRVGDYHAAAASCRAALAIAPDHRYARSNLVQNLAALGELGDAAAEADRFAAAGGGTHEVVGSLVVVARAGRPEPLFAALPGVPADGVTDAPLAYSLGTFLSNQGRAAAAEPYLRRAVALAPAFAEAHANLGHNLRQQGRCREAVESFRAGHELGTARPDWPYPSAQWIAWAAREAAIEATLLPLLAGDHAPADPADWIGAAHLLIRQGRPDAAADVLARVAGRPGTAPELAVEVRLLHAAAKARAATGWGTVAPTDRPAARRDVRRVARADLEAIRQSAEAGTAQGRAVGVRYARQLDTDPAFVAVRHPIALGLLPADERAEWVRFWADVRALREKLEPQTAPPPRPAAS